MEPSCFLSPAKIRRQETEAGPYSLANFLPAGTLTLSLPPGTHSCASGHPDGWHYWLLESHLSDILVGEEATLLRMLDFLTLHEFIVPTCRVGEDSKIYVRIYLVPFDLREISGRLRCRDEATVLSPGRRCIRALLSRVTRDVESWSGLQTSTWLPFFNEEEVGGYLKSP